MKSSSVENAPPSHAFRFLNGTSWANTGRAAVNIAADTIGITKRYSRLRYIAPLLCHMYRPANEASYTSPPRLRRRNEAYDSRFSVVVRSIMKFFRSQSPLLGPLRRRQIHHT